jgi:hypothetical protein
MKKLIYVFMILMMASCSNRASKNMEGAPVNVDDYIVEVEDFETSKPEYNTIKYTDLSKEKLQEMYDLVTLKQSHPEFEETIISQLKNYTSDSLINFKKTESIIKNVKIKGGIIQLSDSVQKMKLHYDVVSGSSIHSDSIWAEVTTSTLVIDGQTKTSNKIKFTFN